MLIFPYDQKVQETSLNGKHVYTTFKYLWIQFSTLESAKTQKFKRQQFIFWVWYLLMSKTNSEGSLYIEENHIYNIKKRRISHFMKKIKKKLLRGGGVVCP